MLQGKDAPKPHDIAGAVAKLVGHSKGSRAARTVVGTSLGADKINADAAPSRRPSSAVWASGTSKNSRAGAFWVGACRRPVLTRQHAGGPSR